MASSLIDATSGVMRMPTASPADAMFDSGAPVSGWTMFGLIQVRAKKPRTTLGIEARISRIGLRRRRTRGAGVLGEVDPGSEPERRRHEHRHAADDERAGHDRADVVHAATREPAVG